MENNKENTTENTTENTVENKTENINRPVPAKENKNSKNTKKLFNSRSLKYGSASLITIAAVIAIAVIVNMIFSPTVLSKVIGTEALKLDLTSNKLYSLGDQTEKIVGGLNKEVKVYALYDEAKISTDTQLKEVNELLKKYSKFKNVKIEYVDTDKNPAFIKTIDPDGVKNIKKDDIVFTCGKKVKNLSKYDLFTTQFDQQSMQQYTTGNSAEQAFTGAIKFVSSDVTPVVYFLEGHNEKKPDTDYATVKEYLVRNNYDIKTLNLITSDKVPDDAEIVIIAAPQKDISSAEKDKLTDYFKNGGKAVFTMDPINNSPDLTQLQSLLSNFNVSIDNDKVKENEDQRFIKGQPYAIIPYVQDNDINTAISPDSLMFLMPNSRSISTLKNTKDYIKVTSLMKTSAKAIGESVDGKSGTIQGPLDLAVAVQNDGGTKSSKIVLIGNATLFTDTFIQQYQQYAYDGVKVLLNSLNWLQDKKDDVIIAPKTYDTPQLQMSSSAANVMALLTVIVLPLLILGLGTFVWLRRRHL